MRVCLVFPPPFELTQPYLSVPTLSAFLARHGHDAVQRDLNVEVFDHFVNAATLEGVHASICRQLDELEERKEPQELGDAGSASAGRIAALERARDLCPALIPRCEEIKQGFRGEAFFDPALYSRNFRLLHRVCETVSAAHYPTVLTPISFGMRHWRISVQHIIEALHDERENLFLRPFRDRFVPSLLAERPELVGISVIYSDQIIPALTLARELKRADRDVPVIIGGDVFSRMARTHLENMAPFFDHVDGFVIDDGRQPLLEICRRLETGEPLAGIPRVLTRESRHVPLRPTHYDSLPAPDYAGLDLGLYFSPQPILSLLAGKGCQWGKCTFCTESFTKEFFPKSIETLVAEIDHLVETFGVRSINFADVDISVERMRELAELLLTRDYRVTWSTRARLTKGIDDDFCRLIARAGCRKLYFGLESSSQRVLNRMRKGTLIARVPDILRACWENGIGVHLFSFVGFPGETREEAQATMEFLIAQRRHVTSFNIGNFHFRTFSDVFKEAEKYGVRPVNPHEIDADLDAQGYVVDDGMTMEEAEAMSYELAREACRRIALDDDSFEIYPASRYVKKKGIPAFDSHTLAYLTRYSNRWAPRVESPRFDAGTTLSVRPFVELRREGNGTRVVFSPASAKLIRLPGPAVDLLLACDGKTPLGSLLEGRGAGEAPAAGIPPEVIALLSRGLAEGLLAEVEPS